MAQWLLDFEAQMSKHYDTPDEFLSAIGYMIAGSALANRVYVMSPDELTTNLYAILVSPPGWFHKSSPLRAGVRMLKKILTNGEFLPTNASSESIGKLIAISMNGGPRGHGVMVYDEFRTFLTHIRKEYAANIGTLVVERFERGMDLQFARKKEGKVDVDTVPGGYIVSFVASTTTPWLLESMKGSDVTGGFLSRFLLVESHEKTRSHALPRPIDQNRMDALGQGLENIRNSYTHSQFFFRQDAARLYRQLYRAIEKGAMTHGHPEYPSLVSRAPTYVKKIALLNAALEQRDTNLILPEDVEGAAELVVRSIKSCETLIDEAVAGDGVYAKALFRVRKVLSSKGRMPKRDLLRTMHMRIRDLEEILESLREQGHVKYEKDGKQEIVIWSS